MVSDYDHLDGISRTSSIAPENRYKYKNTQSPQKKKRMISIREGKYLCTYWVEEDGQKTLITRILITEPEKEEPAASYEAVALETASPETHEVRNDRAAFECGQQFHQEAAHKKNIQDVEHIKKEYTSISGTSNTTND